MDDATVSAEKILDSNHTSNHDNEGRNDIMTTNDTPNDLATALAEIDELKKSNAELRADFDQLCELLREPLDELATRRSPHELATLTAVEAGRQARELRLSKERAEAKAKADADARHRAFVGAHDPSARRAAIESRIGTGDPDAADDLSKFDMQAEKTRLTELLQSGVRCNRDEASNQIAQLDALIRSVDGPREWMKIRTQFMTARVWAAR
jgi:hypothetical protein